MDPSHIRCHVAHAGQWFQSFYRDVLCCVDMFGYHRMVVSLYYWNTMGGGVRDGWDV